MAYEQELAAAKETARVAGEIMMQYRRDGFETGSKTSAIDLVTSADTACQERIVEILHEAFPEDGFLAEEDTALPGKEDAARRWVIDPIDGTVNYAKGLDYFCTSIALQVDDEYVLGVIYAPERDAWYTATPGDARYNDEPITVSDQDSLENALIYTGVTEWAPDPIREQEHALVETFCSVPTSLRRMGSTALHFAQVAAGIGDGTVRLQTYPWDIAAGTAIVTAAGGRVDIADSDAAGCLEVVASNGHLHDELERYIGDV